MRVVLQTLARIGLAAVLLVFVTLTVRACHSLPALKHNPALSLLAQAGPNPAEPKP